MVVIGWQLFYFKLFKAALDELEAAVTKLTADDPGGYRAHPKASRLASSPVKLIVYVWFNDEDTLRKAGAKTDVYETFKRMLARGIVPNSIEALLTSMHGSN